MCDNTTIRTGPGNPLGLDDLTVACIPKIYNIYKTPEDPDFFTWILNPFPNALEQVSLYNYLIIFIR